MSTLRYVIRGGVQGRERLRLLSQVMGPATRALLDRVGIPRGVSCLDVGCGGGDVTVELARRVGPNGRALGVDLDQVALELARRENESIANVAFDAHDVTTWEPSQPFDVVYSRFLLTHLADPAALVVALKRHVKPGGAIIVEDVDFRGHLAEPPCPALDRFVALYVASVRKRGADPDIGPRLPGLLRDAGFTDVGVALAHPIALEGGIKLLTCITLESIADAVLADGLASADELQATIDEFAAFARDPHTVHAGPRVFQAWGRAG